MSSSSQHVCGHEVQPHDKFYIHKCFGTICHECKINLETCTSCGQEVVSQNLIMVHGKPKCSHEGCSSVAVYKCTCYANSFCEMHLLQNHSKIALSRRCIPTMMDEKQENICVECDKFIATNIVKSTNAHVCDSCLKNHEGDTTTLSTSTVDKMELEMKISAIAIVTRIELQQKRIKEFETGIQAENSCFNSNLDRLRKLYESCENENKCKLASIKKNLDQAIEIGERIHMDSHSELNFTNIIRDGKMLEEDAQGKMKSWVSEILRGFETPRIKRLAFEISESSCMQRVSVIENLYTCDSDEQEPSTSASETSSSTAIEQFTRDMVTKMVVAKRKHCDGDECSCFKDMKHDKPHEGENKKSKKSWSFWDDDPFASDHEEEEEEEEFYDYAEEVDTSYVSSPTKLSSSEVFTRFHDSSTITVKMTSMRCPLWFALEKPEMVERRAAIIDNLNSCERVLTKKLSVKTHEYVIIEDAPRYKPRMKRAVVKSFNIVKGTWIVNLLDYGKDINVSPKDIYEMPEEYMVIESTCFRASLMGIRPRSNFCFTHKLDRNTTNFIYKYMLPSSYRVFVNREFQTADQTVFVKIKSIRDGVKFDWTHELLKANLALPTRDEPHCFLPKYCYCYMAHYFGNCNSQCERIHSCPFCEKDHFLTNCSDYKKIMLAEESKKK